MSQIRRFAGIKKYNKKRAKSYGKSAMRDRRNAVTRIKNGETHYPVPWVDV